MSQRIAGFIDPFRRRVRTIRRLPDPRPSDWSALMASAGIDPRSVRPRRIRIGSNRVVRLGRLPAGGTWRFAVAARALRRLGRIDCSSTALVERPTEAIALATAGVPLAIDGDHPGLTSAVGVELESVLRHDTSTPRAITVAAIERAGFDAARPMVSTAESNRSAPPRIPVSVLLASRRPANLLGAVEQVRRQHYPDLDVHIGAHGPQFDSMEFDALERVWPGHVTVHRVPADRPLGQVLEQLRRAAQGELVTKWDDDDFYGADHVRDLVHAWHFSGADVVGKFAEFVYLESSDRTIRRSLNGTHRLSNSLAGGTLLTSAEWLERIGGWRPLPRNVDRALIDDTWAAGGTSYRTHGLQYLLQRSANPDTHTWNADDEHFIADAVSVWPGCAFEAADIIRP